ncbi:MAG: threonylcarbamoyl-AMP synthase [Rhodospirillaceae bacterium]|nr:threonylcarbamoyl-AMP synthase [Rhodospirillaceae bacterium]
MTARILPATDDAIAEAGRLLAAGDLVALPTETVYGLGADATNGAAVAAIFAAKKRPRFNPLIAHVATVAAARAIAQLDDRAERLAEALWPGPLTLVLKRAPDGPIADLTAAGLDTLAVRLPAHPVARAIIEAAGRPIAAPSANRSGKVSPTRAEDVAAELGQRVALIVDAGPCAVGLESTIVDLSGPTARLLRPGGTDRAAIEILIGPLAGKDEAQGITAPGMMKSHYAPALPVRLDAETAATDEALLAFGPTVPPGAAATLNLSPRGDLAQAAANLFVMLRALDRPDYRSIAVMPIPATGLGEAINDRLQRAAAPRQG